MQYDENVESTKLRYSSYCVVPSNVVLSKDLNAFQKLLYMYVQLLANQKGNCWASDAYLAKEMKVTKKRISRNLVILEEQGNIIVGEDASGKRKLTSDICANYQQPAFKGITIC